MISLLACKEILVAKVAFVGGFHQYIGKHRGASRFKIVALASWCVHHLIPQSRLFVLPLDNCIEVFAEQFDYLASALIVLGHGVEQFDESHGVPSLCPSPAVLRESCLFVCPEHLVSFVPGMAVKSSLWVESALVGLADLVNSIIVNLLCLLWAKQVAGSEASIGQPHEYAVEPHLICIDCLVPIYSLLGAWLLVELLHESLHSLEILCLGVFLIHTGHEMARTNLIKIIVFQLICTNLAFVVDHRVGVKLAVFADVVATISKIGVEHGFEFYTHYIAPSWRLCEVEHIRLRHSLHFRVCQPLAIVLIWLLL